MAVVMLVFALAATAFAGGAVAPVPAPTPAPASGVFAVPERAGHYVTQRVRDLVAIVRINVHVGPGYGAALQATKYASVGVSDFTATGRAVVNGETVDYTDIHVKEAGLRAGPLEVGTLALRDPNELCMEAHVVGLGAGVGFNLARAGDFITGLVDFSPPAPAPTPYPVVFAGGGQLEK